MQGHDRREADTGMKHRREYREHPVRTSLQAHLGRSSDAGVVAVLQEEVYHQNRGIYFTAEQLKSMPWDVRQFIESQGRRIFGPRRGC